MGVFASCGLIAIVVLIVWELSPKTVELTPDEIRDLSLKIPTGM